MALHTIALALRDLKFINVTKYDVGIEEYREEIGDVANLNNISCTPSF